MDCPVNAPVVSSLDKARPPSRTPTAGTGRKEAPPEPSAVSTVLIGDNSELIFGAVTDLSANSNVMMPSDKLFAVMANRFDSTVIGPFDPALDARNTAADVGGPETMKSSKNSLGAALVVPGMVPIATKFAPPSRLS